MNTPLNASPAGRSEYALLLLPAAALHTCYSGLSVAVDRLRSAGFPFCAPVRIGEWDGDARHGSFVQIDATTWALHVGRGSYITVDIQRDLNGITPNEATRCMLCRSGTVRRPDRLRSYNAA